MSLGDRIRGWLESGPSQPKRRPRAQAQPIAPVGYEHRPMQRTQWIGLGLAAAAAVALTAGLVFLILTLTRPSEPRVAPTPIVGPVVAASPTAASIADIFRTSTPTSVPTATLPPRGERMQVANTEGTGLNLRREPSTSAEVLKVIPEGSVVEAIGPEQEAEGRRWRSVRDFDGQTGWVPSSFLFAEGTAPTAQIAPVPAGTTVGPAAGASSGQPATARPVAAATPAPKPAASRGQVGNTGGQGANIRSEPGTSGRVLKTLAEGTPIEVTGVEQRDAEGRLWRQVRDPAGVTGWITGGAVVAPGTVPTPLPPGARATAPAATAAPGATPAPVPAAATPVPATAAPAPATPGTAPTRAPGGATPTTGAAPPATTPSAPGPILPPPAGKPTAPAGAQPTATVRP